MTQKGKTYPQIWCGKKRMYLPLNAHRNNGNMKLRFNDDEEIRIDDEEGIMLNDQDWIPKKIDDILKTQKMEEKLEYD